MRWKEVGEGRSVRKRSEMDAGDERHSGCCACCDVEVSSVETKHKYRFCIRCVGHRRWRTRRNGLVKIAVFAEILAPMT